MATTRVAPIEATERAEISSDMLRCRIYGHAWDEFYPDDLGIPMWGWRLSLRCTRCATERHDIIDRYGRLGQRRYLYPDGYRIAADETPSRDELRQTMLEDVRAKLKRAKAINELIMERAS